MPLDEIIAAVPIPYLFKLQNVLFLVLMVLVKSLYFPPSPFPCPIGELLGLEGLSQGDDSLKYAITLITTS